MSYCPVGGGDVNAIAAVELYVGYVAAVAGGVAPQLFHVV